MHYYSLLIKSCKDSSYKDVFVMSSHWIDILNDKLIEVRRDLKKLLFYYFSLGGSYEKPEDITYAKKFWFMQMYICISQRNKWVCPKSDFLKNCDFGWFFLHHKIAAEVRSYLIQYVYCVPVHNYSIFNLNLWRTSIPPQYYSRQSVNLAELG